jgi:hypothetical protein
MCDNRLAPYRYSDMSWYLLLFGDSKQDILNHLAFCGLLLYETETLDLSLKCPIGIFLLKKILEF